MVCTTRSQRIFRASIDVRVERAYPGFRSQGGLRSGGFSDVKFDPPKEDVDDYDFYKSTAMAAYLDRYVDDHVYAGSTLRERIRFGATVDKVEQTPAGWLTSYSSGNRESVVASRKLIVATGSTSVPNMPELPGRDAFDGPIVHTLNYGRSKVYERKDTKNIAVVGGGKSAADMVYENVKAGRNVKWIIRASGKGPGAFLDVKLQPFGLRNAGEVGLVRATASILTLPGLQHASLWQRFMFNTRIGSWFLRKFREFLTRQFVLSARYDDRPGARETFKNLKTEIDAVQLQTPAGGCHHDDFWESVAQNVDVYRKDIDHLEKGRIVFTDGTSTDADAILCGTGFKDTVPFFTEEQRVQLGLPHSMSAEPTEMQKEWERLNTAAEEKVMRRFYSITAPPSPPPASKLGDISPETTPFRLYSGIAPLSPSFAHTIAFIGFATITNMFASSELSAIWATAYLDGHLSLPSEEKMREDVAYVTTYMRMRCPTYGRVGNWYIFDLHQFVDRLMGEVGLRGYRKGWWGDLVRPLLTEDWRGLRDEYIEKYGGGH